MKKLYESLAEEFSISVQQMKEYIKSNTKNILDYGYDEYTVEKIDITSLLNENFVGKLATVGEIMVHHITPRANTAEIKNEGLMTLPHALTEKTALSNYLAEKGFEFSFDEKQVYMKNDGGAVDISKLEPSNLLMRLGGKYSLFDFNVNGYLFVTDFRIADCLGWLGSPEILKSLANAFGDRNIADDYAENYNNYLVSFRVPIEQVDIAGYDANISREEKTEILIKCAINALACMEEEPKRTEDIYNPIIMLKRNFDVPGENVEKIWTFRGTLTKIVPEE